MIRLIDKIGLRAITKLRRLNLLADDQLTYADALTALSTCLLFIKLYWRYGYTMNPPYRDLALDLCGTYEAIAGTIDGECRELAGTDTKASLIVERTGVNQITVMLAQIQNGITTTSSEHYWLNPTDRGTGIHSISIHQQPRRPWVGNFTKDGGIGLNYRNGDGLRFA